MNIVDDVPTAAGDTNAVTATENQLTLTGNVLTNDVQGADRVPTGPITAGTFVGTYGTLVLAADGSYTPPSILPTQTSKTCTVAAMAPRHSLTP
nr:hypothetical protein [Pseudomonas sp. BIGb0427]